MLNDVFEDVVNRHVAASEKNDLETVAKLCDEYEGLLNAEPENPHVLFRLGTAKLQLGCVGSAVTYLKSVVAQNDDLWPAWGNLGSAYRAMQKYDLAWTCYQKELELHPENVHPHQRSITYGALGSFFVNEGNPEGGLEYMQKALEYNPENFRVHWNYGLLLLELGRWKEGFQQYEYGLLSFDRPNRHYPHDAHTPYWEGQPGKVVVYGEQGIGDEIMFGMCLPKLMAEAPDLIFDCHPRLQSLWERSLGIKCHGTRKDVKIDWPTEVKVDYKIPIGSLFLRYFPDGDFPRLAYLQPDPARVQHYRTLLEQIGPPPYVGMGWRAGEARTNSKERSFKLSDFKDLVAAGGTWVSLQYRHEEGKCERFYEQTGLRIHHWPDVVEAGERDSRNIGFNYDETAALVAALDLCIVPNTTVVHLCGALGKECWTLTPDKCAWRYYQGGDHMPMYGDWVRQFRENGDWDACFERVLTEFKKGYL